MVAVLIQGMVVNDVDVARVSLGCYPFEFFAGLYINLQLRTRFMLLFGHRILLEELYRQFALFECSFKMF